VEQALLWSGVDFAAPPWPGLRSSHPIIEAIVRSAMETRTHPPDEALRAHVHGMVNVVAADQQVPRAGDRGETIEDLLAAADAEPNHAAGFAVALAQRSSPEDKRKIRATATSGTGEGSRAAAFLALGDQDDDVLLDVGLPLLTDSDSPSRLERAVRRGLRRLTSRRAIEWARSAANDPVSGYPARAILTNNAEQSDRPQLRALLADAVARRSIYDQCSLVDVLHGQRSEELPHCAVAGAGRCTGPHAGCRPLFTPDAERLPLATEPPGRNSRDVARTHRVSRKRQPPR
jgi:hypothetical protein